MEYVIFFSNFGTGGNISWSLQPIILFRHNKYVDVVWMPIKQLSKNIKWNGCEEL